MDSLTRLQVFFRGLFQFDLADLDFGLYRLFHLKQTEIEAFITEQLPREVDTVFAEVSAGDREWLQDEIKRLAEQVRKNLADDAILPTGEIASTFTNTNLGKDYMEARRKLEAIQVTEGHRAEVFNHLVTFFSRYYEEGDFIPKRRFGARETCAVPYNGEEVFFHWANRDQHYVKTAERFQDYAFTVEDLTGRYRIRFIMTAASIARDNTKGNTRHFFPCLDLARYDTDASELMLPFEYRLPTPKEVDRYGQNSKAQEAILDEALPRILAAAPDENLRSLLQLPSPTGRGAGDAGQDALTILQKRLRHFCRRNTSDYFIHKDLQGFLSRELEFYIKDQVLHLMDLEADLEAKRRVVRTFRKLAEQVTAFLATIEDAQKTLFEKRKFVLATDYLIPIQHVPRDFWPEILATTDQIEEWRNWGMLNPQSDLFNPDGAINEAFLAAHPTLPVHTRHFDRSFTGRLLEALPFKDLDEATDGLLVHGENYQALNLLFARYREQVKCIYIDPPYNTGNDDFIYKDRYQHSSWLAMMEARLRLAHEWMSEDGTIFVSIDDNEQFRLREILNRTLQPENFLATIIWQKVYSPKSTARHFSEDHDYIVVYALNADSWSPNLLPRTEEMDARYSNPDNDSRGSWKPSGLDARNYYSKGIYAVICPSGRLIPGPPPGSYWRVSEEKFKQLDEDNRIWWGENGNSVPAIKRFLSEVKSGIVPQTLWKYEDVGHTQEAKKELLSMILFQRPEDTLNTVKPTRLIERVAATAIEPDESAWIFDFFAGSGTTGHAVINLNREDGGQRKFILVEMGEYFDSVLLPRIAKVMFTPEWKEGKPKRPASAEEAERTPRLVKVLRLESYEDALHNLTAPSTLARAAVHDDAYKELAGEDAYRLRYWIELPLRNADTCLQALELARPFVYSIEVLNDDGPVNKSVDLVETFNLLYGLRVQRYATWNHKGRRYRAVKATDRTSKLRVLALWRDMDDGCDPETERAFLESKIAEMAAADEVWDEILINGDSPTPGVISLDPLFKRLMMAGEAS